MVTQQDLAAIMGEIQRLSSLDGAKPAEGGKMLILELYKVTKCPS